ncbi:hypothetical protein [Herpetosiphon geysericola]|uniref:Uncharacterized protein n=1 Tax=Herpetosiphon geysericola TaxID=70996 RepID=A0A0P6XSX4_9CHLR|nr:hypothetical protein [Herpetosiphon geysericola]KPL86176.1 hypothetical protein SE18_15080 [Herpetosiphon geysericola]
MQYAIALYDPATNVQVARFDRHVTDAQLSTNGLTASVRLAPFTAKTLYAQSRILTAVVSRSDGKILRYRTVTLRLIDQGLAIECHNLIVALDDLEYDGWWSVTKLDGWLPVETASSTPERWEMRHDDGTISMSPRKNEQFSNAKGIGRQSLFIPANLNSTGFQVIQFDWRAKGPTNWLATFLAAERDYTSQTGVTTISSGNNVAQTGSMCFTFGARPLVSFAMYFNAAAALYIGETGDDYLKISNLRVATTFANMVNTTTSGAIAVGTAFVTVASTANISVGQRLTIESGGANSESVIVLAVNATQFQAAFTKTHVLGVTVRGIVVTDKEIVEDVVIKTLATNPNTGIKQSTARVSKSGRDCQEAAWSAKSGLSVVQELADCARFVTYVDDAQYFYYGLKEVGRTFALVDGAIELEKELGDATNQVRVAYKNASNQPIYTAFAENTSERYALGTVRQRTIASETTDATEAATLRSVALLDAAPTIRSSLTVRAVRNEYNVREPLDILARGDTITVGDFSGAINKRSYTLAETAVNLISGEVTVTPEAPIKQLDLWLAQG